MKLLEIRLSVVCVMIAAAFICTTAQIRPGAGRPDRYLPLLKDKRVGLLTNATGEVDGRHTIDLLRDNGVDITVIFTPEHGLRGTADAGESVSSGRDSATGLPIVSLYGKGHAERALAAMSDIDVVVTDLQDVGTRFYTYYITMMELMNAAAKSGKGFVVLDRPNPNGMYVDGPILERSLYSGVGKLPIPIVHGMTLGELALMINGEGWLDNDRHLDVKVVPCEGYTRMMRYSPPVAPSPNLRNQHAILLYPSLCFFEGTPLSVGRGTDFPFELYGHPLLSDMPYEFTPRSTAGAKNPPLKNQVCHGRLLNTVPADSIIASGVDLSYIIEARDNYLAATAGKPDAKPFFTSFFDLLAGSRSVRSMIEDGMSAEEIRASWQPQVNQFKQRRAPYLIYPDR